jgi:ppGpp synthetase/RelA/SpoT-type nucleotidyltranferase
MTLMDNIFLDKYWKESPLLIKEFLSKRENYQLLCNEIVYVLRKLLREENIEFSSVTCRAKTLNSFLEKINRKYYANPFSEITDFSGVRIVFLYVEDYNRIEKLIQKNFKVLEKVDKLNEKDVDQFGYGAIHFIVQLNSKFKGARYDDIKNYVCEIQVRTILQDAWAIIDHHLVYKKETDVPAHLRRKLNSLAGLFETADDQFQRIKEERITYIEEIEEKSTSSSNKFLETGLNLDSFTAFLNWKYPDSMKLVAFNGQVETIYADIDKEKYSTLKDLNLIYTNSEKNIEEVKNNLKSIDYIWSKALDWALRYVIYDKNARGKKGVPLEWNKVLKEMKI